MYGKVVICFWSVTILFTKSNYSLFFIFWQFYFPQKLANIYVYKLWAFQTLTYLFSSTFLMLFSDRETGKYCFYCCYYYVKKDLYLLNGTAEIAGQSLKSTDIYQVFCYKPLQFFWQSLSCLYQICTTEWHPLLGEPDQMSIRIEICLTLLLSPLSCTRQNENGLCFAWSMRLLYQTEYCN